MPPLSLPIRPPTSYAIEEGAEFSSLQAFKDAVKAWSLQAKFTHVVRDSDRYRVRIGCRSEPDCPFVINAKWREGLDVAIVTKLDDRHTCIGEVTVGHQVTSSVAWLKANIPKLLEVDSKTTTKQLKSVIRLHHGVEVPNKQLTRAKREILAATVEGINSDFKKILAYLDHLVAANPPTISGDTVVDIQYDNRRIHRVFVCPGVGAHGNALPFLALDGTYVRNCFHSTLLTATGRDNN